MEWLKYVIPGIVAIVGNIVFYYFIKNKIDSSIERFKISYSGVFKEKIAVYKNILEFIVKINYTILQYQHKADAIKNNSENNPYKLVFRLKIYYEKHEPFISDELLILLGSLVNDFMEILGDIRVFHMSRPGNDLSKETWKKIIDKFYSVGDIIKPGSSLFKTKQQIIKEMRKEMRTNLK